MEGVNKCPNPDCEGGGGSLYLQKDPQGIRNYSGWIHCDWCGVSGPTSDSDQDAKDNWNKMAVGAEDGRRFDSLGAKEALFGFIAWLTSRKETLTLSRKHVPPVDLITEFAEANGFAECREDYADRLKFPGE